MAGSPEVQGTAGNGGDSRVTNSITGGAAAIFTLSQTAIGGNGGRAQEWGELRRGRRKPRTPVLHSLTRCGGDVFGTSAAVGGNGEVGCPTTVSEGTGGDGGTAHAQIDLTSAGSIFATVSVTGGNGGGSSEGSHGGKGADVSLDSSSINATSTTGDSLSSMLRRGRK